VVCSGRYFVVTRPGYLHRIDTSEFERRRRHAAPIVSEYFDFGILNEHWRKDHDA
jgi:hypothetical protein